jgi:polyisoprenoid-binding protein YceI
MNNRVINVIVLLIALAYGAWFGFKSYINAHKVDSEVEKSETTVSGEQVTTESGATINKFDHLNGSYASQQTDPPTSELLFETYGTTATQGTFKDIEISATFDGTDQASITVSIDVASIYTAESMRDDHLRGEEFFNVAQFSTITFQSTEIVEGESGYVAKGDITFLGNTKSLEIPFSYSGSATGKENTEVFEGGFDFNPMDYGMESDAGDKVTISFYTELSK